MIVRELITLLGFQVQDDKLKKYEEGIHKAKVAVTVAATAVLALGTYVVKTASDMEQTRVSFEVMMGSAKAANKMVADLYKMGAKTPYESKDLVENAKLLMQYGISAEDTKKDLMMLGDVAGGNAEKLGSLSYAFAQVQSNGKMMGQDLMQMINAGFNPLMVMANGDTKKMAELREEMSKGNISAQMVTDAFQKATSKGGQFYGMMDKQSKTFSGRFSTFMDNLTLLLINVGNKLLPMVGDILDEFSNLMGANQGLISSGLTSFLQGVIWLIAYIIVIIEAVVKDLGGWRNIISKVAAVWNVMVGILRVVFSVVWKLRGALMVLITTLLIYQAIQKAIAVAQFISFWVQLIGMAQSFTEAMEVLNLTMLANPMFWIIAGVVALIAIIWVLVANWDKVVAWLKRAWDGLLNAFKKVWNWIWSALDSKWLQSLLAVFAPFIGIPIMIIKNWSAISAFFTGLWKGIVDTFFWAIDKIKSVWGWLVGAFDKVTKFLGIKPTGKDENNPKDTSGGRNPKPSSPSKAGVPPSGMNSFAKGTDYVDHDQIAMIHEGEKIIPKGKNTNGGTTIVYQIQSKPNIVVPPGTPKVQQDALQQTARQVVRDEWQSILRQTRAAYPKLV
jgi:tape measure domain-containing protein